MDHHIARHRFGIHVDPEDDLLVQGAEGYQLTWMDAKVDDWVVTPRRGKAVEINALWYNALRLLEQWLVEDRRGRGGGRCRSTRSARGIRSIEDSGTRGRLSVRCGGWRGRRR